MCYHKFKSIPEGCPHLQPLNSRSVSLMTLLQTFMYTALFNNPQYKLETQTTYIERTMNAMTSTITPTYISIQIPHSKTKAIQSNAHMTKK